MRLVYALKTILQPARSPSVNPHMWLIDDALKARFTAVHPLFYPLCHHESRQQQPKPWFLSPALCAPV